MNHRIVVLAAALCVASPAAAWALDFDFQDDIVTLNFAQSAPLSGPGVFPSTHTWSGYYEPGTYTNNGVTLVLSGFDAVAIPNFIVSGPPPYQGTPAFTLSQAIYSHGTGEFELENIPTAPAGDSYDLVLYGTNFAANAGTIFALTTGSGTADRGINFTVNAPDPGRTTGPNDLFSEGRNYVVFDHVVPVNGIISGTATPLFAEADLNAVQLVAVPETLPGDFNTDGQVDPADVSAMEKALNDLPSFESANGLTDAQLLAIGDLNHDGKVNNADLQALLNLLQAGGGSTNPIPEPSTFVLAVLAAVMVGFISRYAGR
jgi:hypothetical protein